MTSDIFFWGSLFCGSFSKHQIIFKRPVLFCITRRSLTLPQGESHFLFGKGYSKPIFCTKKKLWVQLFVEREICYFLIVVFFKVSLWYIFVSKTDKLRWKMLKFTFFLCSSVIFPLRAKNFFRYTKWKSTKLFKFQLKLFFMLFLFIIDTTAVPSWFWMCLFCSRPF